MLAPAGCHPRDLRAGGALRERVFRWSLEASFRMARPAPPPSSLREASALFSHTQPAPQRSGIYPGMRSLRGKSGTVVSATARLAASRACRVCVLPRAGPEEGGACAEGMNARVNTRWLARLPQFPSQSPSAGLRWTPPSVRLAVNRGQTVNLRSTVSYAHCSCVCTCICKENKL